jgi:hypothetical protein
LIGAELLSGFTGMDTDCISSAAVSNISTLSLLGATIELVL